MSTIPHIKWSVNYKRKEWDRATSKYVVKLVPGECILAYLEDKSQARELKTLSGVKETKFKGRFGLRKGPLLVLFVKRPTDATYKNSPIVIDNGFITKWSAGHITDINSMTCEEYFTIGLRNKYQPNKTFMPLMNKWFGTFVTKKAETIE